MSHPVSTHAASEQMSSPKSSSPFSPANLMARWQIPEDFLIVMAALIVGFGTGLGAVAFIWMLARINEFAGLAKGAIGDVPALLIIMAFAGLVVGAMIERWASEAKGHGVPEVMEAVAVRGGRIRPRVALVKVLASSLTIGSGGSAGREGPIVQVGSTLGSALGQFLHFSDERVRILVACGAAAGIAATFNAPIAGTIFAMEVILSSFTVRYFGAVVISSVSASIVTRVLLGSQPAFSVPAYPLHHLGELPIYILLGFLSAIVAILFIRILYYAEDIFDRWAMPLAVKAATGMVLTALVALLLPDRDVLGPGLHAIGEAIATNFNLSLGMLIALLVLKILATTFTLGAGNSGGVFAPSLFMGAVLGGIVGTVANSIWPDVAINPGAYAIVGMASVFAGAARAPITAILIVFEMSGDYKLILPLMLATVLSTLLAEFLFKESIYTLKLKLKGISLESGRDTNILTNIIISDVMTEDVETIPANLSLEELSRVFARTHRHGLLVLDLQGKLWGIVTIYDLENAISDSESEKRTAADIGTTWPRLIVTFPDETVQDALSKMGTRGIGRLPVVSRDDPYRLLGLVRRDDIIRAYDIAITRRSEIEHRTRKMELEAESEATFVELPLSSKDPVIGCSIQEIASKLPHDCILVSVQRNGKTFIPHGDTVFEIGDQVTAFASGTDADDLFRLFHGSTSRTHQQSKESAQ